MPHEPYSPPRAPWKRFAFGCVLIVALVMSGTAAVGILEAKHVESFFPHSTVSAATQKLLPPPTSGPQTFLVVGSDRRAGSKGVDRTDPAHSDTMMLVHMDPDTGQTTILSIPRDLQITLPGYGINKINAAYTYGGTALALKTVKANLPGIQINHVVDVNFSGFMQVVGALGCVYVFVDRHYYNPQGTGYASIDIQPGYQKLCYTQALDYVRYRHTDSDFVRVERQQDFIRAASRQVNFTDLFYNQDTLLGRLRRAVQTDVHGGDVLNLLNVAAHSLHIRQVKFQSTAGPSYVTATPQQIRQTVADFLHGGQQAVNVPTLQGAHSSRHRRRTARQAGGGATGLTATPQSDVGAVLNAAIGQPLKYYVPRQRLAAGAYEAPTVRSYALDDGHGHVKRAYVVSIPAGLVGEYYGVEGTTWTNPPLLKGATQTITQPGRTYMAVPQGSHLHVLAWRTGNALYWVNNTLSDTLSNAQMLAIANSAHPVA